MHYKGKQLQQGLCIALRLMKNMPSKGARQLLSHEIDLKRMRSLSFDVDNQQHKPSVLHDQGPKVIVAQ